MGKYYNCIVCNKRTKPKERRIISKPVHNYLTKKLLITNISDTDIICNTCKHKYYLYESCNIKNDGGKTRDPDFVPKQPRTQPQKSPPCMSLPLQSAPNTHSRCLVCKRAGPKMVVVSSEARLHALVYHNIFINPGTRCCPVHITENDLILPSCYDNITVSETCMVNRSSASKLIKELKDICGQKKSSIDFDNISTVDCKNLTGLSLDNFNDLCKHVIDKVKCTPCRSSRMSVGIFLLKMKSGMSNTLLSTICGISRSSVRRAIATVRQALMRSFVSLYLGLESVTREAVIRQHTRPLAKELLNCQDSAILVMDGTYIYIQKSNNFNFQRQSYSMHKYRPLVKPMVIVTTTGHFVSIMGPYLAKNNDSSILNHMIKQNVDAIKEYLNENDLIVVDRGFRDSLSLLENMGIKTAMPSFMKKGEKQMSTEDANTSRLVTKVRIA